MKVVQSVLLAVSLLSPAAVGFASAPVQESSEDSYYDHQDLVEAIDAFGYAARESLAKLQSVVQQKGSSSDLSTGIRLSRQLNVAALDLAERLENGASNDEIADKLVSLENTVTQLDAIKRRLVSRYNDQEINKTLTYVRTVYFYTKRMLTGEI